MTHADAPQKAKAQQEDRPLREAVRQGPLSAREREILDARARGLSAKQIAFELQIEYSTVRVILVRVREKLSL